MTVTLPLRTLQQLQSISADRARAIVKAVDSATRADGSAGPKVEVVEVLPGRSVILVGPSLYLKKIEFLHMAEITPTRFLLTLPSGTGLEALELAIADQLDDVPDDESWEKELLSELLRILKSLRRSRGYFKAEMIFVKTPAARR
ncbi:MAG TPA: hypothetical protein P5567_06880 [Kiritimatiellia bacterium]|nr:hypothetical protein [Kiritimatiellia bacterium]HRZ12162.1 hypothetical protein [Kiritimatiellia bacterium]HSA18080.1 hypothetical protein [Kiritimatiellia bacterium]